MNPLHFHKASANDKKVSHQLSCWMVFDHPAQARYRIGMSSEPSSLAAIAKRKLATAVRLPWRTLALSGLVWMMLWPARLLVLTVPLRILSRAYGDDCGVDAQVPPIDTKASKRAQRLAAAIELAARYSPASANCYPQALVAHLLLSARGVGHALFFGLHRTDDATELKAHAWVMAGGIAVTGGRGLRNYTVVRCFVSE